MKSSFTRRAASGAVVALAAATLSLGATSAAHADTTVTDLEGTVTGVNGAPAEDIHVEVHDAATGDFLDSMHTDAAGHYDFTSLEFNGPVKIWFEDHQTFDFTDTYYYADRWYGGSRYEAGAAPVTISIDGDTKINFAMTQDAILAGSVAAGDGHTLTDYWGVDVVDADFNYPDYEYASSGTSFRLAIEPGTYRVGGYGQDLTGPGYFESWWRNADTIAAATPIAAGAGQTVSGLDLRLGNTLAARQAPRVAGVPAVGRPLTATPGSWNRNAGTEFSYTWMRGATVVGTGATYTPTAADFGSRLNVIVRALNGANVGQATSAQTDVVRYPADERGRAKALAGHKVRFAVALVSAKQKPVRGKVVVLRGSKVVHKAVKLVKGKAVILVKHQPKGRQTFTVLYKGNSVLAKATKNFTVRVR